MVEDPPVFKFILSEQYYLLSLSDVVNSTHLQDSKTRYQLLLPLSVLETKLHVEVHTGRTYQSGVICQVQPKWRMACQFL
jgi:hypothetical protein